MRRSYLAVVAAVFLAIPMGLTAQDRKQGSRDRSQAKGKEKDGSARFDAARKELAEAVKSGKISREDAAKRRAAIEGRLRLGEMKQNLQKLVKEGKLSQEDADKRFEGAVNRYRKSLEAQESRKAPRGKGGQKKDAKGGDKAQAKAKEKGKARSKEKGGGDKLVAEARRKLAEAVKSGKISREDAAKKWKAIEAHIEKQRAQGKGGDKAQAKGKEKGKARSKEKGGGDKLAEARRQIVEAVKAGKLSREDAGKKMKALMAKGGQKKSAKRKEPDKGQARAHGKTPAGAVPADAVRQIAEAVKAGKLSREDAGKKLRALKARGGQKKTARGKEHDKAHAKDHGTQAGGQGQEFQPRLAFLEIFTNPRCNPQENRRIQIEKWLQPRLALFEILTNARLDSQENRRIQRENGGSFPRTRTQRWPW